MKMNKYWEYAGPVMIFDRVVDNNWKTQTWAPTEKKALNNLAFRYKKDHGLDARAKVSLDKSKLKKREENSHERVSV